MDTTVKRLAVVKRMIRLGATSKSNKAIAESLHLPANTFVPSVRRPSSPPNPLPIPPLSSYGLRQAPPSQYLMWQRGSALETMFQNVAPEEMPPRDNPLFKPLFQWATQECQQTVNFFVLVCGCGIYGYVFIEWLLCFMLYIWVISRNMAPRAFMGCNRQPTPLYRTALRRRPTRSQALSSNGAPLSTRAFALASHPPSSLFRHPLQASSSRRREDG